MNITASSLAVALALKKSGRLYVGACPSCGYAGTFTAEEKDGRTLVYCHSCRDQAAIMEALKGRGLWGSNDHLPERAPRNPPPQTRRQPNRHADTARRLWAAARSAEDTATARYLETRGYAGPIPPTLRHLALHRHTTGTDWPVMLGAVTCWPHREVVAVHRTYLREDGSGKAPVDPAKMTLGPISGGAVRLAPAGPVLALAEGIETALSVMVSTGLPTWACLSAGGLREVRIPDTAAEIVIAADNDKNGVGQDAAEALAARLSREGRKVRVLLPPRPGMDFNDMLKEGAA